jgi:hypothetical protein
MSFHFVCLIDLWVSKFARAKQKKRGEIGATEAIRIAPQPAGEFVTGKFLF